MQICIICIEKAKFVLPYSLSFKHLRFSATKVNFDDFQLEDDDISPESKVMWLIYCSTQQKEK